MTNLLVCLLFPVFITSPASAKDTALHFERIVLSEHFHSEGADFGDFDGDGHMDVVSGPFWYAGPEFQVRHRYMPGERISIKGYSKHFFSFVHDFNADGSSDILVIGMPGEASNWYENPGRNVLGNASESWKSHHVLNDVGNESPMLTDITGDGQPELVCVHAGVFGYAEPDWHRPQKPWSFVPVSTTKGFGRFTHGLGVGDIDGDGDFDLLETNGWHEQRSPEQRFTLHPHRFAQAGGSQMHVYDFDGDGDNDVVSVQNAHAWGLTWFERRGEGDDLLWVPHPILGEKPAGDLPAISQMHALALADMDGDGIKDLVTGKRFFAHGGGDPGAFQLPVLYWFRTIRSSNGGVRFEPHLIDARVGVGTQLRVGDLNADGRPDIVVGNKLGTHVLLNRGSGFADPESATRMTALAKTVLDLAAPGTDDFARGVRETEHRTPAQEMASFVLPPGFEVQLVASEPDIAKPLNMAFDARGRLWVTNTLEYPWPVEVGKPGRDSIKILEDRDGDGTAEHITDFADGLNIPMGLYPYKDGVICYSIPYIWFLRDTDGDGQCDRREKLYGPFDHTRDTHGMCNGFLRGFDGWLYACHGFNNESSVAGRDGNRVEMKSGNTFRIRLDGSRIEHYTHGQVNPFGMSYDARGDLFTADCHTKPVTLLLQNGYYESFGKPHDGLGFVPNVMDHSHGSTAIGGIAISDIESRWPIAYANNAFGGNVMTSRINRNSLIYNGSSVRAQEEPDLLVSGDPWFRPVDLKFGPDGSLYVADFYNRIIGHYEVPLEHPGRDRTSGRIWKIVYRPNHEAVEMRDDSKGIGRLVNQLGAKQRTRRMLAVDHLSDKTGTASVPAVRSAFYKRKTAQHRIHAMWTLHRLDAVRDEEIDAAVSDSSPLVRGHAFRLLGERGEASRQTRIWLRQGLSDSDPSVNRAAVMAIMHCRDPLHIDPLINLYRATPANDVHLRHAIRMALRDNSREPSVFASATHDVAKHDVELWAGICVALKTHEASRFLAQHIATLAEGDKDRLGQYARLAMLGVTDETAETIVNVARLRFENDVEFQISLLNDLRSGLAADNTLPSPVTEWATDLAVELMQLEREVRPILWTEHLHPQTQDRQKCWVVSNRRKCADTHAAIRLWSSFTNGEQRTAILRSGVFDLPTTFEFFLAGHDGYPEQQLQKQNMVRVRDATDHQVLKSWSPPRNDTAQPQKWTTGENAGRSVYVELIDGDTASAYAWLAVGRFSVEGLNPNRLIEDRRLAMRLVSDFRLDSLRGDLQSFLSNEKTDRETRANAAHALAALDQDARVAALAETLTISSLETDLRLEISRALASSHPTPDSIAARLASAVAFATTQEQERVAGHLCTDRGGMVMLLELIENGHLNTRVLSQPTTRAQLNSLATPELGDRIGQLVKSVEEPESIQKRIDMLVAEYDSRGGDVTSGQRVFEKSCANCHRVGGKGAEIGPNLDGIGSRGLQRVSEDVLAPSRNVDVAFRSSMIVTDSGKAHSGLIKAENDRSVRLVDSTGKEVLLSKREIELRKQTSLSPMPSTFSEALKPEELLDLMSYLLSLNR